MNEKIPFKKDIIFKSSIGEITDITLTHDYKIKEDMVEGVFYISGKYKMTEASIIEEEFFYNIPFSIAIGERINKDTINLVIDSFDYKFKKDILSVNMNLNMNYEEDEIQNSIEELLQREEEKEIEMNITNNENEIKMDDINIDSDVNIVTENNEVTNEEANDIIGLAKNNITDGNAFSTYKVINMRESDTLENVIAKYNITMDDLKLLNNLEDINTNNKIIIPVIKNE